MSQDTKRILAVLGAVALVALTAGVVTATDSAAVFVGAVAALFVYGVVVLGPALNP